jgi:hypothetical protein
MYAVECEGWKVGRLEWSGDGERRQGRQGGEARRREMGVTGRRTGRRFDNELRQSRYCRIVRVSEGDCSARMVTRPSFVGYDVAGAAE